MSSVAHDDSVCLEKNLNAVLSVVDRATLPVRAIHRPAKERLTPALGGIIRRFDGRADGPLKLATPS